jgi:hypothetical protein
MPNVGTQTDTVSKAAPAKEHKHRNRLQRRHSKVFNKYCIFNQYKENASLSNQDAPQGRAGVAAMHDTLPMSDQRWQM